MPFITGDGSISTINKVEKKKNLTNRVAPEKQSTFRFKKLSTKIGGNERTSNPNKNFYALKTINLKRVPDYFKEELRNEIEVLKTLDHPNIIRAYETFEKKDNLSLVMQLCTGGDLNAR